MREIVNMGEEPDLRRVELELESVDTQKFGTSVVLHNEI